jgi:hypothetical protein
MVGSPALLLHRALLAGLAVLVLVLGVASLGWPFSWDHGVFAWIGDTILRGGMPYRDAWDVKGPLTFYVFAAVERLTGTGMVGIRAFDLLMLALGVGAAATVARRIGGPGVGAYVGLGVALQYLGAGYFETAQPDGWAAFLVVLGLLPIVGGDESRTEPWRAATSALLLGTCVLLKPVYGIFGAAPAAYILLGRDLKPGAKARGMGLVVLTFGLPAVVCAAWFGVRGALPSLVETYLHFNLRQASVPIPGIDTSLGAALQRFVRRLAGTPVLLAEGAAALFALPALRTHRRSVLILFLTVLAALFAVYVQQRYWNRYHWHVVYLTLGVAAGIGLGRLWHRPAASGQRAPLRVLAAALGMLLLAFLLPQTVGEAGRWLGWRVGRISRARYEAPFRHATLSWTFGDSRRLAAWLAAHTDPGDRIFVWSDPLVYYLSGRRAVGRLGFHVPVTAAVLLPEHRRYRAEMLSDLDRHPPRYVALARRTLEPADSINEANIGQRWPELRDRLLAGRAEVARFGGMGVYGSGRSPSTR